MLMPTGVFVLQHGEKTSVCVCVSGCFIKRRVHTWNRVEVKGEDSHINCPTVKG